jgi:serine/threonine protein kinase
LKEPERDHKDDVRMMDARELEIVTDPVLVYPCVNCAAKLDLAGRKAFSPVRCPACRAEMQVPARMAGFLLVELLGTGGMGSAYRARDEALNRDVAIKIMLKSFGDDPKFVETFRREAQAAARLNHPNVVQIYSFGEFKGQPFIVMELVTGGSLDRQMSSGEPLDPAVVMRVGMEIASALQSGYQSQLIHGDIKPENILLDDKGAAKLVDFGIAQLAGCQSQEVWGTPYYIAPEKVKRQRFDCRADIYSLGGTLYHAIAGKPPFDGADAAAVVKARFLGPAQPITELREDLDPEVETIVARMLQLDPSMRYPTYESLLDDLRRFTERAGPGLFTVKKLVFKKKGAVSTGNMPLTGKMAAISPPTTTMAAVSASPAKGGASKLVIKKGGATMTLRPSQRSAAAPRVAATRSTAPVTTPPARGVPVGVVVLLIFLFVALAAGVGAGVWFMARMGKAGMQPAIGPAAPGVTGTVVAAATGPLDDTRRKLQECRTLALVGKTNLQALAAASKTVCDEANAAVTNVLGAEQYEIMIPLRPPPPASANPPAATNAAAAPAPQGTNTIAEATNHTAAATNGVHEAPAADPVDEATVKDPVVVTVRNMYRKLYKVDELAAGAAALHDAVDAALAALAPTSSVEAATLQAMKLEGQVQPYALSGSRPAEARRTLDELRQEYVAISNRVIEIRKELLKKAAAEAAAEAERSAQQKRESLEAARKLKIADEIGKLKAREGEIKELLHKHAYAEARRKLGPVEYSMTEEESRNALKFSQARIDRLELLQEFFIGQLPGYQDPDGWKIEAADKKGLSVRNRGELKMVLWGEVGDVRIGKFIRYLLMRPEESARALKLREHVQGLINASIYCQVFILPNAHAQTLVEQMVGEAQRLFPDSRKEIEKFLPEFVKPAAAESGAEPAAETKTR